jgi:CheY-specific phosphatase CheX
MPENLVEQALVRATGDVLEQMFFAGCLGELPADQIGDPAIAVRMAFDGERRGVLALRISTAAARTLASDFLGADTEDGPDEAQVREVVKELANMICGHALSTLERSPLRLAAPRIVPADDFVLPTAGLPTDVLPTADLLTAGGYRSFDLGNGGLTVALTFGEDCGG